MEEQKKPRAPKKMGPSALARVPAMKLGVDVFTTGMIAKMLGVSPRSASTWFDKGLIKGFRIPGSNDRRVYKHALIEFLNNQSIPVPRFLNAARIMSVVGNDYISDQVDKYLGRVYPVMRCGSLFTLGCECVRTPPLCVIFELVYTGTAFAMETARMLRRQNKLITVGLLAEGHGDMPEFDLSFNPPYDLEQVSDDILTALRKENDNVAARVG